MRVVEKFYSVAELELLLSLSSKTLLKRIADREFGTDVVNMASDKRPEYRVPASAVNAYLERRRVFSEPGIAARSVGELRRKASETEANTS